MSTGSFAIEILIAALRHSQSPVDVARPFSDADLAGALALARDTKILSLVGPTLVKGTRFDKALLDYSARTLSTNSTLIREGNAIVSTLSARSIHACIIKGPLQQYVLQRSFYVRPCADIDIVVDHDDFAAASDALIGIGFQRTTTSLWWRTVLGEEHFERREPVRIAVDLHHRVGQPGLPGRLNAADLLTDSTNVDFGDISLPTPGSTMALLLSAVSISKALYNREASAAYITDISVGLIAGTPPAINSLLTAARRHGLEGSVVVAFRLLSEVYGPLPNLPNDIPNGLPTLSREQLLDMIFRPSAPETRWPKRRHLVWELSGRRPATFARELLAIARSEATRRLFERGRGLATHID